MNVNTNLNVRADKSSTLALYSLEPYKRIHHRPSYNTFSDGALNIEIKVPPDIKEICIRSVSYIFDFTELAFVVECIRSQSNAKIIFDLRYMPYARQDRRFQNQPLSCHVFISLLNSLKLDSVLISDIHNEDLLHLIDNVTYTPQHIHTEQFLQRLKLWNDSLEFHILFPDQGAGKKYYKYKECYDALCESVHFGNKVRENGRIRSVELPDSIKELEIKDNTQIILVDDICDGGGTFLPYAKEMNALVGRQIMHLFVTHGIFSKGLQGLRAEFKSIQSRTVNTLSNINNWKLFRKNKEVKDV